MAKRVIIISESDYDEIINCLKLGEMLLREMRKSRKRQDVEFYLERALTVLTGPDEADFKIEHLERLAYV